MFATWSSTSTAVHDTIDAIIELDFLSETPTEAVASLEALARLERATQAAIARCALRIEGTNAHREVEAISTPDLVAQVLECDKDVAQEMMRAAETIDALPVAHLPYRTGEISAQKARALARGVAIDPRVEDDLLHLADYGTIDDMHAFLETLTDTHSDEALVPDSVTEPLANVVSLHARRLSRSA